MNDFITTSFSKINFFVLIAKIFAKEVSDKMESIFALFEFLDNLQKVNGVLFSKFLYDVSISRVALYCFNNSISHDTI